MLDETEILRRLRDFAQEVEIGVLAEDAAVEKILCFPNNVLKDFYSGNSKIFEAFITNADDPLVPVVWDLLETTLDLLRR